MAQLLWTRHDDGTINCFVNMEQFTCDADHPKYDEIWAKIGAYDAGDFGAADDIPHLMTIEKAVLNYVLPSSKITVENGVVKYKGVTLNFSFVDRLLQMLEANAPVHSFVRHLERLMRNPNVRYNEKPLCEFLSKGNAMCHLPLLPDGRFIAYKRVREDLFDFHATERQYIPLEFKYQDDPRVSDKGWLLEQKGHIEAKPRFTCDTDPSTACSEGLHAGRFEYLRSFHWSEPGVNMAVAVDPIDVLAAHSSGDWKIRATKIECRQLVQDAFVAIALGEKPPTPKPGAEADSHNPGGVPVDYDYEDDEDEDEDEDF